MFELNFVNMTLNLPPLPDEYARLNVSGVCTDTRALKPGQLFVALSGPNFDGHNFVPKAFALGAIAAIVSQSYQMPEGTEGILIRVDDPLYALGELAKAWRAEHSAKILAITGSSGKTTSKEMLALVMGRRYQVLKTAGNFNNLIGLPLTLLNLNHAHGAAIIEMGMSWPGEIARLTEIAGPDIGLITNVGLAHLENMGSLKSIAAAKAELWQNMRGIAVVNVDDPLLAPWARKFKGDVITFGHKTGAQITAGKIQSHGFSQSFMLHLPLGRPVAIRLNAPGAHNVQNALGVAAAAFAAGLGAEEIAEGLRQYSASSGRFRMTIAPNGAIILDDAYNANPDSMAAGIKTMATLLHSREGVSRAVAILADMLELGSTSPALHREIGKIAAHNNCGLLLAYGSMANEMVKGAKTAGLEEAYAFQDMDELKKVLLTRLNKKDIILVKGSNSMGMERVVSFLEQELKEG